MQPLNNSPKYQSAIFGSLANMLIAVNDFNGAANMFWNFTQLFDLPQWQDSEYWGFIRMVRRRQAVIPQDTIPFHLFTLPLLPLAGVASSHDGSIDGIKLTLSPNPAKDNVMLSFTLPQRNNLNIKIYDILGREVLNVASGAQDEGLHSVPVDLRNLSPGSYYIRMEYAGGVRTEKMVVANNKFSNK